MEDGMQRQKFNTEGTFVQRASAKMRKLELWFLKKFWSHYKKEKDKSCSR